MKHLTLETLKTFHPCLWYTTNNYERAKEIFGNKLHLTAREIANLSTIPNSHKVWAMLRMLPCDDDLTDIFLRATRTAISDYNNGYRYQSKIDISKFMSVIVPHLINKEITELESFIKESSSVYRHYFIGVIFKYILNFAKSPIKQDKLYYTELMCNIVIVEQTAELLDYICERLER